MRALRLKSSKIAEMLERRSVDICCVQESRFRRNFVRIIKGKSSPYELFWIGNLKGLGVGIFLVEKRKSKVIDRSRVKDRVIAIEILVHGIIV